ncbi:hypothetical protein [Allobranchiibius huperziae]|uniref:Uncharacterized protein n=1 Tax=Allobranchiibius huperziae TaxID=1874116 RepID=A0A853DD85_9MICO|nr:hypothetical protein [Allobranchiibius huperziae]NYJ75342.1 hypothetical protein [Allobranchiibius huperziae]
MPEALLELLELLGVGEDELDDEEELVELGDVEVALWTVGALPPPPHAARTTAAAATPTI